MGEKMPRKPIKRGLSDWILYIALAIIITWIIKLLVGLAYSTGFTCRSTNLTVSQFKKSYKRITKNNMNGDMRFGKEKLRMV